MSKRDQFIEEIVRETLTEYFKEIDDSIKLEAIERFTSESLPIAFDTRFGKVSLEISITNLISQIADEMNTRLIKLPVIFKDGSMDVYFEEEEGLKAGLRYFTKAAVIYLLSNLRLKAASTLNIFFEESLSISLMIGQANLSKKIGITEKRIPSKIDVHRTLNKLKRQELSEDKQRIARTLGGFKGLKSVREKGRPSQWTPSKLERDVKRAAKNVLRQRDKLTLDKVTEEMNKQRDGQAQLTEDALKQALVRNGLKWGTIKRAVINN